MFLDQEQAIYLRWTKSDLKSFGLTDIQASEILTEFADYKDTLKKIGQEILEHLCKKNVDNDLSNETSFQDYVKVLEPCPICKGVTGFWDQTREGLDASCTFCKKKGVVLRDIKLVEIKRSIESKLKNFDYGYTDYFDDRIRYSKGRSNYKSLLSYLDHMDKHIAIILWKHYAKIPLPMKLRK